MGLPTRFIRESIKDSESAWSEANAKPRSGGRLLIDDGKATQKEALKACALAAVLLVLSCTNTHRVARSIATNR